MGVTVELWRLEPTPLLLAHTVTDQDDHAIDPLLPEESVIPGRWTMMRSLSLSLTQHDPALCLIV